MEAKKENKHIGGSLDDFLAEEGILEASTAVAVKRVVAMQIMDAMKREHITKVALAKKMNTSRAQLNRVLDPEETGTTIESLTRTAVAVGTRLDIRLVA